MSKGAIDRAIELRQMVIDGGVLWTADDIRSSYDIENNIDHFRRFLSDLEFYSVRMQAKKKRVPLTKEDLDARFVAGKTMRISNNGGKLGTIEHWGKELRISWTDGYCSKYTYSAIEDCKFIDGDPCYKEVEE
jgi:hypothetical protein